MTKDTKARPVEVEYMTVMTFASNDQKYRIRCRPSRENTALIFAFFHADKGEKVPQLCHIQLQKEPTVAHLCTEVHEIYAQKTPFGTAFSEIAPFCPKLPAGLKIVVSTVQFCPLAPQKTP
jgi:hypothetical protein